jgi:glycerophosphoryl diester phosphodiesterase
MGYSYTADWRWVPILSEMTPVPLAIAHRGDPIGERENTLAAFSAAVRHGADMIELDLRRTADGVIVVLHDATLERLWGDPRPVADLDVAALRLIGDGTDRVPTLTEVLDHVDLPLMIDFTETEVVAGAVDAVRNAQAMARSLFVTWNLDALRTLRALAPEARIGVTWIEQEPPAPMVLEELAAEFWNPMFRLVTPDRVDVAHELGVQVSTWTVDEPRHMARVAEAGVDAIVSNRIADLRQFISREVL